MEDAIGGDGLMKNPHGRKHNSELGASIAMLSNDDEELSGGDDDAAGYMWGMNILTGRTREEDEAAGRVAPAANSQLVQLRYGSYQGVQLSMSEIRRIKAEESQTMLTRKRLCLVLDLDHTLLNSATYHELDDDAQAALRAWARSERGLPKTSDESLVTAAMPMKQNTTEPPTCDEPASGEGGTKRLPLLFHLNHIGMWTKLRPYVREFLEAAAKLFDLYVYTMGARAYAAEMVKLLDPDGSLGLLNADRVISKEDGIASNKKSLDVMLGSEQTTIILDDSPAVWPQRTAQLLVPRRYHFFPSSAARDSSLPPEHVAHLTEGKLEATHTRGTKILLVNLNTVLAILKFLPSYKLTPVLRESPCIGSDEASLSGQLHSLQGALERIHEEYFSQVTTAQAQSRGGDRGESSLCNAPPLHVADSVRAVRRSILQDVRLVFSHVIPLQQQRKPETHAAWRLAKELGAQIQTAVGPSVTHVVAGSDGTDKVRWARAQSGVHAVSIEWLASCGYSWRRVEERTLLVESAKTSMLAATHQTVGPDLRGTLPPPQFGKT